MEGEKTALDTISTNPNLLVGENKPIEATESTQVFVELRAARREGVWDADALPYAAWIQPARYAAGVFVFIGLAGTVVGIALSLSSLGGLAGGGGNEAATTDQLQNVLRSVGAILSGMKTAAFCTVLGIGATLWQSFQNNQYLMFAATIIQKAERVWRDTVRVEYAEAEAARHKAERQQQSDALEAAYRRLEEQLTANLSRAHKENSKTLSAAVYEMGEAFNGATRRLDDSVTSLTEHISVSATQLSDASQTAARVADTLEAVRGKLEGAAAALTETMEIGYAQLGQIQNLIGESAHTITVGHEKLSTVAQSLETVVARVGDDRAASLDALTQDRTQTLQALRRDREQTLQSLVADRDNLLAGLQATLQTMENERASALAALENTMKASLDAAASERETLAERFSEVLRNAASEREAMGRLTRDELRRAQDAIGQTKQDSDRLFEVISSNHQKEQDRSETLLLGVRASDKRLTDLLNRFEKTLTEVAALSEQAQLRTAVVAVAEKLDATQKASVAGADALRSAALVIQNSAAAQRNAQEGLDTQARVWGEAGQALRSLQSVTEDLAGSTIRVVVASEQATEQLAQLAHQQSADRSDLLRVLWSIENSLNHEVNAAIDAVTADEITTNTNGSVTVGDRP